MRMICLVGILTGCAGVKWPGDSGAAVGEAEADTDTDTDTDTDADADADTDADTDTDTDTDADTDTDVDPTIAPRIDSAKAECQRHTVGEEFDQWLASAEGSDPQGIFTLPIRGSTVAVKNGAGTLVNTFELVKEGDTDPVTYSVYFDGGDYGLPCGSAASTTFTFRIQDDDHNLSEPYTVSGIAI